ncbi:YeaC family protein [Colwellia sp. MEBiC06753]
MDILQVVENLTEEMYLRFLSAVETGKWPEGTPVDQAQRDTAMQIVMAYQSKRLKSTEMLTIGENGEIVNKTKRELKAAFNVSENNVNEATAVEKASSQDIARFSDL